ncbi:MAG: PD-(D/E)XK nuclease-like domain-containing protein, partial [Pseudomonadota bacterium]
MRQPGIYADIDIDEYHREEGISSTGVSLLLDCPARYFHEYHKNKSVAAKECKAFTVGRAVHMAALEPEKFDATYYLMNEAVDLRTTGGRKAYADAKSLAQGRQVLRVDEIEEIMGLSTAIKYHPVWRAVGAGKTEQSIYWNCPLFATRLRSRPDFFNDRICIDIKTTDSIKNFQRSVMTYGYHRQAA